MLLDFTSIATIGNSIPDIFSTITANPVLLHLPLKLQLNFCIDILILFFGSFILLLFRKRFHSFHIGLPFFISLWILITALFFNADSYSTIYTLTQNTGTKSFSLFWDSFSITKTVIQMKTWFYLGNIFLLCFVFLSFKQTAKTSNLYYTVPLVTLLLACTGSLVLIASNLLTLLLCIETFSFLGLYVIRLLSNKMSAEASLLYFFMSMLSTGFLSLGFLLIYLGTGAFTLPDIADAIFSYFTATEQIRFNSNISVGLGLIFGTFLFKLAAFPCFFWLPLTFKAMSFTGIALTSFTVKFINVCLFILLCVNILPPYLALTSSAIWILLCALGSIVIGTFLALQEFNFRKFLAFTSINQMGYILLGLLPLANNAFVGFDSLSYFVFVYFLSSLLFLSSVAGLRINNLQLQTLSDLRSLFLTNPWSAWMCVLSIFAMAGLPPTTGFWAKYYIIRDCWDSSFLVTWDESFILSLRLFLGVIVFLNFFSAIYYVRLVILVIFNPISITWTNIHSAIQRGASLFVRFLAECKNFQVPTFHKGWKYATEVYYSTVPALLEESEHVELNVDFFVRCFQFVSASFLILNFLTRVL